MRPLSLLSTLCTTFLVIAEAHAFDPEQAQQYNSPDLYRPNVDRLIAHDSVVAPRVLGPMTSLAETDPPASLPIFTTMPQVSFRGRQYTVRVAPKTRTDYAYTANSATLIDPGAGQNGPATAGYGLMLSAIKQGFPAQSSGVGELDTLMIAGRQSGPTPTTHEGASDYDGIQANYQQAGDPGYLAGAEFQGTRIDPKTFKITHDVSVQIGIIDPFGKNGEQGKARYSGVNRLTFGFAAIANSGPLDRAFYAVNSGSKWEDFIYAGNPGVPTFRVKGSDGAIVFGPDRGPFVKLLRDGEGTFAIHDATGKILMQCYQGRSCNIPGLITDRLTVAGQPVITGRGSIYYPPVSALPRDPKEGETFYLSSARKTYTWDGSVWQSHW